MTPSSFRSVLAVALVLSLTASAAPSALAAAGPGGSASPADLAELTGRVVAADGVSPRSGVVVHLYDSASGLDFPSQPTGGNGAFAIDQAPAGAYSVVVESNEGVFLANDPVQLAPGRNSPVSLRLQSGASPNYQTPPGGGAGLGSGALSPTVKWIVVGGIVVAAALVINEVTDDEGEEQLASPF